jgi:excisionase family DNA binding protein
VGEPITRKTRFEDLPDFLSVEETRVYLGLGRSTLYELLRRGELKCVKFGRVIRIARGALRRYVEPEAERPSGRQAPARSRAWP